MKSTLTAVLIAVAALTAALAPSASYAAGSATTSAPALSSVTLNLTDVAGGTPVTGTVTLTSAAVSGGLVVAMSSDNTAAATVPPSVTVPAGATRASFPVTTLVVTNPQSALIIGTAGGVTAYAIVTVRTQFQAANGSISILPAGNGSGLITSQPAGINCTVTLGSGAGACSSFFPAGTVVKLNTQARPGSRFQGWRGTPGCSNPSKIKVFAGTNITCQGGFALK
ncbi:hypothetical protein [Cryobacterium sp. PH31-O1]|uniref:hypothetical protein n=1 Tax=Cryobacterium sp. PH31-O1 TaxID=3046306 RepID=UPI0024BB7DC2|nr:hypothetical protein [Cryobacterium sp. PH31-O1]MDJ0337379.1 hypothetical protein [Cryobacterium sp. PH31-O1]